MATARPDNPERTSGTGKTSVARELAQEIGAMHVRVESIEHALRASEPSVEPINDHGFRVAHVVAEDNLRLQRTVADSVNPPAASREEWRAVALRASVPYLEVELVCVDPEEHRRRVETRVSDIAGHKLPTWDDVLGREYDAWDSQHLTVDTSKVGPREARN
jgi:predicted kinase